MCSLLDGSILSFSSVTLRLCLYMISRFFSLCFFFFAIRKIKKYELDWRFFSLFRFVERKMCN